MLSLMAGGDSEGMNVRLRDCSKLTKNHISMDRDQLLLEPFEYLMSNPGKDFRSTMIAAFDLWIKVPVIEKDIIKQVIAMLHTSSLLYLVN